MATPPLGYSSPLIPESREETYNGQVADKAISLTKSSIHQYLESFLNPLGINRNYLKASLSSEGLQYVTDLTYDDEMKVSPNLKKTYLARFFAENTGRLPSILLIDQGVEDGDVGINALTQGFGYKNQWKGTIVYYIKVNLSITVATYSEEDTTTLSSIIFYIFNTLCDAIDNRLIRGAGKKWEVRLPMTSITASQMSSIPVEGDNKSQIWTRSIDLICDFETVSKIQMPTAKIVPPIEGFVNGASSPQVLNLQSNQAISLGSPYLLFIRNMRPGFTLGISDPNIALISDEQPWYLQPRRQGKAVLYIYSNLLPGDQDKQTGQKKNLILDIPFRVTL